MLAVAQSQGQTGFQLQQGSEICTVDKILAKKTEILKSKKPTYLVSWVERPNEPTWEPEEHLENVREMLRDFDDRYKEE